MTNTREPSEKVLIEIATADKFLAEYNKLFNCNYAIKESDRPESEPDILCIDEDTKKELALEIALLEDIPGDIRRILGRSENKPISATDLPIRSIYDALTQLVKSITNKRDKDYGQNVALIIRHASGVNWNFELYLDEIEFPINLYNSPYDKGIWLLTNEERILQIDLSAT